MFFQRPTPVAQPCLEIRRIGANTSNISTSEEIGEIECNRFWTTMKVKSRWNIRKPRHVHDVGEDEALWASVADGLAGSSKKFPRVQKLSENSAALPV
ncbi:hypothetical protein VTL71DRAFT_9254, partial [Oculimacula yallundae]